MMNKNKFRAFLPVLVFFIALNGFFISAKNMLIRWGIDQETVLLGNLFLLLITLISFFLALRGLKNPNPHAFVRSVYASMLLKLFLCIVVVFLYLFLNQKSYNKPALFTCMGLYLVYSFLEVSILMKLVKGKVNG
jgi:hypothetical protein